MSSQREFVQGVVVQGVVEVFGVFVSTTHPGGCPEETVTDHRHELHRMLTLVGINLENKVVHRIAALDWARGFRPIRINW